ncbi:hypothetical protein [Marispirochaeta sp.]|jgi:hypothetical protein|uniref:hypothetical protein n=1 Tax=Marispirochaeta sp. TaxID=2038653 RepID=UPI0029C6D5DE|nr:hypothetical protein [Marispirochaeta sp.]
MKKLFILILAVMVLSACLSPPSSLLISEDTYLLRIEEYNLGSSKESSTEKIYEQAAELCFEKGFNGFIVVDSTSRREWDGDSLDRRITEVVVRLTNEGDYLAAEEYLPR